MLMEGGVRGRITVNVPGPAAEEFPLQRDIVIIQGKQTMKAVMNFS